LRKGHTLQIGRTTIVLLAVALLCSPLAAAAPAASTHGWSLLRTHAKGASTVGLPSAARDISKNQFRYEALQRRKGKPANSARTTATFDRAGFSIGGGFHNESATEMGRDLDSMKAAGGRWARIDVNWAVIQAAGRSSYNWAPFDRVVSGARSHGLSVLAEIIYTPSWARPAGTTPETPPTSLADYANFARAAVARYAPLGVHAYEIWNEPNNAAFWAPKPDVARYTAMLRAAYPAINAADPSAVVVTGGTSPASDDGRNIAPVSFLRGIYANGGRGLFDAVGHHPYCYPAFPGAAQPWSAWYQMYGTPTSLRSLMAGNGDSAKQIWATEFGAPTSGPGGSYVDEATQAAMLTRAFELYRTYTWAGPMFWYSARDLGTSAATRENFYGLLHRDFSAKPAYHAFLAMTRAA
jgi:polysaccharide biosynthesis protein PslG